MKYVKRGKYFFNGSQAVLGKRKGIWSQILGFRHGVDVVKWHLNEADDQKTSHHSSSSKRRSQENMQRCTVSYRLQDSPQPRDTNKAVTLPANREDDTCM